MNPPSSSRTTIPTALPERRRDHVQGSLHAPIILLEYGDYECPYCGQAHAVVKAIQQELEDRMCFAFRHFPLTKVHPHAEHAAEAAEAAGAQGEFWEMHDLLFENQDALEDEDLARYAAMIGLDVARLIREVLSGVHAGRVREHFRTGVRAGVNGTPTFFINGLRYDGIPDFGALLAAATSSSPRSAAMHYE